jgi:hypothetical protein
VETWLKASTTARILARIKSIGGFRAGVPPGRISGEA